MKKNLFVSVCAIFFIFDVNADVLIPSDLTPNYTKYTTGDGKIPQGDCLEMMCQHGCVEEKGSFVGYCCPGNGSCRVDGRDIAQCCENGQICKDGVCVNNCSEPTKTSCSIGSDVRDAKGCILVKKINCEETEDTPICNTQTGQCVGCTLNEDCSGRQYCNVKDKKCSTCPTKLPTTGQACTNTCGCANGLECVQTGKQMCGYTGVCQSVCETNNDCKRNEYCAFENYTGQCEKGVGQCRPNNVLGKSFSSKDFGAFYSSGEIMTWWSAENWCLSHGRRLTGVYPSLGCYYGYSSVSLGANDYAHCCKYGTEDCWDMSKDAHKNKVSDQMKKLRKALGKEGCYWTDYSSSCHAYTLGLPSNQIWNTPLTGKYSLGTKNHMHALCQ